MDWRVIVKALLADIKQLKVDAEIELVLGKDSKGVVAIKIKTRVNIEAG